MNEYEKRRLENIARNQALINNLGLDKSKLTRSSHKSKPKAEQSKGTLDTPTATTRKRKRDGAGTSDTTPDPFVNRRTSARLAASNERPDYSRRARKVVAGDGLGRLRDSVSRSASGSRTASPAPNRTASPPIQPPPRPDAETLRAGWTAWEPTASPPSQRDPVTGEFTFDDRLDFTPNKSPSEILQEGAFGGTYFRPLRSRTLGIMIEDDWRELPSEWFHGIDTDRFATSEAYDAEVNKYKVACGQSIEEWENHGWINHAFDVRGWFQWYCRFYMGRRCEDDDRQVSRWRKCVGPTGRWRRTLLKKYREKGVREVFDDGEEEGKEVSPVVHQTCHHWAFEVRQSILDDFWVTG